MEKFKYKALNSKGRPIKGVLGAMNENDLYKQLQAANLELVTCSQLTKKQSVAPKLLTRVKERELIQLFIQLEQLESAGVSLLEALADIRDTSDNSALRDAMSEVYRDVSEGSMLSEAFDKHPKIFKNLHISLIGSGEQTGKMTDSYRQLIKYLKWKDAMDSRVRKATRYPMILGVVVIIAIGIMMGVVVPQIVQFIRSMDFDLPFATTSLIATSDFIVGYWLPILIVLISIPIAIKTACRTSDNIAYQFDRMMLELPKMGPLIRKINIARFAQTFGALYAAGLPILEAIKAATNTVDNRALIEALESIQSYIKTGSPLSEAFNGSGEFPSLVIRMIKVGEDSGKLTEVLDQVSEFYTNDVDEEVQKLIAMIEPSLTMVLGGMIMWIAVGVFGPIYSSFSKMEF